MSKQVGEYKNDFVIKLTFEGIDGGDPLIRRIRLARSTNGEGIIKYEELADVAIRFQFPEDRKPICLSNYKLKLTYFDVDSDLILFDSTEELLDALDQYMDQGFLTIFARVERVLGQVGEQQLRKKSSQREDTTVGRAGSVDDSMKSGSCNVDSSCTKVQVQSVVESIRKKSTAKSAATCEPTPTDPTEHINRAVTTPAQQTSSPVLGSPQSPLSVIISPQARRTSPAPFPPPSPGPSPSPSLSRSPSPSPSPPPVVSLNDTESSGSKVAPRTVKENPENKPGEGEHETEGGELYIHYRHTCDICFVSPIVGKRYHATNIPDYDLCQRCYDGYNGDEIKFQLFKKTLYKKHI